MYSFFVTEGGFKGGVAKAGGRTGNVKSEKYKTPGGNFGGGASVSQIFQIFRFRSFVPTPLSLLLLPPSPAGAESVPGSRPSKKKRRQRQRGRRRAARGPPRPSLPPQLGCSSSRRRRRSPRRRSFPLRLLLSLLLRARPPTAPRPAGLSPRWLCHWPSQLLQ